MTSQLLAPLEEYALAISNAPAVACPRCSAALPFVRGETPHIDECGFESYRLRCTECHAELAGIIDPFDDALLLSENLS